MNGMVHGMDPPDVDPMCPTPSIRRWRPTRDVSDTRARRSVSSNEISVGIGGVACDSYIPWQDDIRLLKECGAQLLPDLDLVVTDDTVR